MLSSNIPPKCGKVLCRSPAQPNINTSSVKRALSNVFAKFPPSSNNPRTSRPTTTDRPARSARTRSRMLMNLAIPVGNVTPSSNARSTLMRVSSSNSVYVASLAMFALVTPEGVEQYPT